MNITMSGNASFVFLLIFLSSVLEHSYLETVLLDIAS